MGLVERQAEKVEYLALNGGIIHEKFKSIFNQVHEFHCEVNIRNNG